MATNAKSSSNRRSTATSTTRKPAASPSTGRTETSQVREGVTKARHGAVAIVRQSAERAIDVPVGAALTVRDRVSDTVEPWTSTTSRDKELKSLRTQVTRELNKFERRGGQARRKANQRVRSTRTRLEREAKARRREVEKVVKENRVKAESALTKAQERVSELV
jgi:hypothetical protein